MAKAKTKANGIDLDQFEAYRRERELSEALGARLAGANERLTDLQASLSAEAQAARLDEEAAGIVAGTTNVAELPSAAKLEAAEHEVNALARAVGVQREALAEARASASIEICEPLIAEHRARVRRIHAALVELSDALQAEQAFRDRLDRAGVERSAMIPVMTFHNAGRLDVWSSPMAIWTRHVDNLGYLTDD